MHAGGVSRLRAPADGMEISEPDDGEALSFLNGLYPVSRESFEALERYRALLSAWQAKTNLVAPGTLNAFWSRHVGDSLQVLALFPSTNHWIDLGSGAGFPGLVIAIAQIGKTGCSHVLVESNSKKCAFLRTVARETGADAAIVNGRIESVAKQYAESQPLPEIVTARALAPLPRLLELAEPLLAKGAIGLFHKGREFAAEIEDCRSLWRFDLVIHESRIAAGSVLLEVRNLARADARR